ncbi:type IV pilin [Halobacterium noricense]|uniref:type IV pilin n=1 Tax=Halobacterium noricense TaxID=223182 RepID=UPI001E4F1DFD|nr:type IV pilin [Halobacterium noricense]UHH25072.1 type IV pilin [Halobacterium noricense]
MARGYAPVAVVLLLAVTVVAAAAVATAVPALPGDPPPQRAVDADATSDGRVTVTLLSGEPLDTRSATVRVAVDGEPLAHQPPVPYFAARGFRGGPAGPFNVAADSSWTVGETASLQVAGTNSPDLRVGATLTVRVLVGGHVVAVAETTVETAS